MANCAGCARSFVKICQKTRRFSNLIAFYGRKYDQIVWRLRRLGRGLSASRSMIRDCFYHVRFFEDSSMSATINNAEKNVTSVKKAEAVVSRRHVESKIDSSLSPLERARRACLLSQDEDFSVLGRIFAVC